MFMDHRCDSVESLVVLHHRSTELMGFVYGDRERPEAIPNPTPDPRTQVPVQVKVVKGFWWNRRIVEPGERVTITQWFPDDSPRKVAS